MKIAKWNYISTLALFWHYLMRSGEPIYAEVEKPDGELPKYSAQYLALGHFNYESHADLYDFNKGEWPAWLIKLGKPFMIYW